MTRNVDKPRYCIDPELTRRVKARKDADVFLAMAVAEDGGHHMLCESAFEDALQREEDSLGSLAP